MRVIALLTIFVLPFAARAQLAQADSALRNGEPWRASQLLAPMLGSPASRTPDAVILAARAAAAWEGWPAVTRLLEHEPWLDTRYDRLGRRLLAEAALNTNHNPEGLAYALASAVPSTARDAAEQGHRLVLVARAYDRLNQLDSAAINYRRAMRLMPELQDWLALRAAGVSQDSSARVGLYAGVALPAATPRIPWTEALARDRSDDIEGAAVRYDRLGAHLSAIQVRWRGAPNDSARTALIAALVDVIRTTPLATDVRDALDFALSINPPYAHDQRLAVARRAALVNRPQDAVDQFAAAARDAALSAKDQVAYGTALGALQRWSDAAAIFATITDSAYAGQAAYYHARALMRSSQNDAAIAALHQVIARFPRDTMAAGTALHLLGDLALDAGQVDSARGFYLRLATRYPSSTLHSHALLLAALIAFYTDKPDVTVRELSRALEQHAVTGEVDASHYWLARASASTGDTATARSIWRELVTHGPDSYYAVRSAARLDTLPWPTLVAAHAAPPDSLDGVFARAELLDAMGLNTEARFERDRIAAEAKGAGTLERVAEAFSARGFALRASQLGTRAVAGGLTRDATLWSLIYPMPFAGALRADATQEQVDPLLVASVIRQESGFDVHATSRTNARGLMQVEPAVGKDLAQLVGLPDFDPAMLWVAQVNLVLGIHHFATALAHYPEMERGVAAYNAGLARVDHWTMSPLNGKMRTADQVRDPIGDIDMFVERIPFTETRDYVRAIVRNREVYRMIYR